jgi:prolyl oligopeptidase
MRNKHNCYEDLYAIAEDLIASGRCTPQTLALTGGSNGGLMAGVAITERPELWQAVVPRVPLLDLIGACRDPYTRMAIEMDYSENVDDPDEVRRLAKFSPYHLVREGVRYPAVFLDAGETDSRCPAWHARKFAACLQQVSQDDPRPVLLHVWDDVGHMGATNKSLANAGDAECLAFVLRHLGVSHVPDIPI